MSLFYKLLGGGIEFKNFNLIKKDNLKSVESEILPLDANNRKGSLLGKDFVKLNVLKVFINFKI